MSQTTHPSPRISSPFDTRRTAILLGSLGFIAAALIVLALTVGGAPADNAGSIVSDQPAPAVQSSGVNEELRGNAAATAVGASQYNQLGGPDEAARGQAAGSADGASPSRQISGPDEAARGQAAAAAGMR